MRPTPIKIWGQPQRYPLAALRGPFTGRGLYSSHPLGTSGGREGILYDGIITATSKKYPLAVIFVT